MIDFRTHPDRYRHWRLSFDGPVATLALDVQEDGGLEPGYALKLNSYDLGVDIELHDAVQRLRFEHPGTAAVILTSAKDGVFSSGANIPMLAQASHAAKVNFCKFTNETRNAIEDAGRYSGQTYICVVNGIAAGGGYELALATEYIILVDDGSTAVSLPEVPSLAVLPATGGLTRLVDKRHVRRDRADFFCTLMEGVKGKRAKDWRLVDDIVPRSRLIEAAVEKAMEFAARSDRPRNAKGIELETLSRSLTDTGLSYGHVSLRFDRDLGLVEFTIRGPSDAPPADAETIRAEGCRFWPLAMARELDDAILHLRANEPELGIWILRTEGDADIVAAADAALLANPGDWFVREVTLHLKRVFKRLDMTSRSLIALIEPGSCFTGTLLELALAADVSYMLDGAVEGDNRAAATLTPTAMNFGPLAMANGLTRLQTRFLDDAAAVAGIQAEIGNRLGAEAAERLGLVTFIPDDIDWHDEVRLAIEQRANFSSDALTGLEANLRFAGPETMETKIFGRLSAWQNWIFQRPNAVGEDGALKRFGTGRPAQFDRRRV